MRREVSRQMFHLFFGIAALALLLLLGRSFLMGGAFFVLLIGFLAVNRILLGGRVPLAQWFLERFERPGVHFPGWGSACYGLGVLFLAGYLDPPAQIAAALVVLAIGDGFSTLAGKMGRVKLPWNRNKTLEGTLAFLVGSGFGYYFVGPAIIPVAIVAALVESIDWPLDDNLMIPVACTIVFWLV